MNNLYLLPSVKTQSINSGEFHMDFMTKIVMNSNCPESVFDTCKVLQKDCGCAITKAFAAQSNEIFFDYENTENESYQLEINKTGICIKGGERGLFYGVQTLRQIIKNCDKCLPCVIIEDEPDFAVRGFYHDVTRGKVPKLETLFELIDTMAYYKMNQLQLYIEHTYAFSKQSEVWFDKDPLTAEEILLLDEYCIKNYIELVPSFATFGHLYELLGSRSYKEFCEIDYQKETPYSWIERMRHHTIDISNPKSIDIIKQMIDEVLPLFSSDKFNICCDETFDLGKGKSKQYVEEVGEEKAYVDFVKKTSDYVSQKGKTVLMWGDILSKYPNSLANIPKDTVLLNWHYSKTYDNSDIVNASKKAMKQYACPGTSGWNHLMNDFDNAYINIEKVVKDAKENGALGILNTDWGDFGHINFLSNSIPMLVHGANKSWSADDKTNEKALSFLLYGDTETFDIIKKISECEIVSWGDIVRWLENKYLSVDVSEESMQKFSNFDTEKVVQAAVNLETIMQQENLNEEQRLSAEGIYLLQSLYLIIHGGKDQLVDPQALAKRLEFWFVGYSKAWRLRNKESELYRIKEHIILICNYLRD